MRHEKIFKRQDGSQCKITVCIIPLHYSSRQFEWKVGPIQTKGKGKRKWQYNAECTNEEILEAKMELWHKLTPELITESNL